MSNRDCWRWAVRTAIASASLTHCNNLYLYLLMDALDETGHMLKESVGVGHCYLIGMGDEDAV